MKRTAFGLAGVLVAGLVALVAPSSATAATSLGGLVVSPATGLSSSPISMTTSSTGATKGCPAAGTNVIGYIDGPSGWNHVLAVQNTDTDVSHTADFPVQLADTFLGIAQVNALSIVAGKYTVTVSCADELGVNSFGDFTTSIWFTDATHYRTTDPSAPQQTVTSTALAVSPGGTVQAGTSVRLTATVTPGAAGTVQFTDGTTPVGAAVPVANGTATASTTTLGVGSHSLKATFTPTDAARYTSSTSAATTLTVTAPPQAVPTTTTISATPSTAPAGSDVTLVAAVAPGTARGVVQFTDANAPIGTAVQVTSGSATLHTTTLTAGTHTLRAVFTPADASAYAASTSTPLSYVVTSPPAAVTTTTALTATPAGTAPAGADVTLRAAVTPAGATGTIQFKDGATLLGAPLPATAATLSTTALTAGTHQLTATFTPTDAARFTASTSSPLAYTITPVVAPTRTALALSAAPATAKAGDKVTFTATVTPEAAGTVTFTDGNTALGTAPTTGGTATLSTTSLATGDHRIGATFTPADATRFTPATATPITYTVAPAPAASETTTTLAATPSTAEAGDEVTLSATVSPTAATGSVKYVDVFNGTTTTLGTAPVGQALRTTFTTAGTHALHAEFVPADAAVWRPSSSPMISYPVVQSENAQPTTIQLSAWTAPFCPRYDRRHFHPGPCAGALLIARVKPDRATGSVDFSVRKNARTFDLGTARVENGWAFLFTSINPGIYRITGTFTPDDPTAWQPSTGQVKFRHR